MNSCFPSLLSFDNRPINSLINSYTPTFYLPLHSFPLTHAANRPINTYKFSYTLTSTLSHSPGHRPGVGAPGREPVVSEDEMKAMMAYYFKQQEEMKRLAESSEDDYLHSAWADSKQLQRNLRGQSDIRAPGLR